MIFAKDVERLYKWTLSNNLPLRKDRVASKHMGYTSKICYIKFGKSNKLYPHKKISEPILDIVKKDEILGVYYILYPPKINIKVHIDHNTYNKRYLRLQLPIKIPNNNNNKECYIEWIDSKKRIYWKEYETQLFDVEKLHLGANKSDKTMEFLYVDINPDTKVEL